MRGLGERQPLSSVTATPTVEVAGARDKKSGVGEVGVSTEDDTRDDGAEGVPDQDKALRTVVRLQLLERGRNAVDFAFPIVFIPTPIAGGTARRSSPGSGVPRVHHRDGAHPEFRHIPRKSNHVVCRSAARKSAVESDDQDIRTARPRERLDGQAVACSLNERDVIRFLAGPASTGPDETATTIGNTTAASKGTNFIRTSQSAQRPSRLYREFKRAPVRRGRGRWTYPGSFRRVTEYRYCQPPEGSRRDAILRHAPYLSSVHWSPDVARLLGAPRRSRRLAETDELWSKVVYG